VVPADPPNAALFISNLSKPFTKLVRSRGAREGQDGFDIGDAIKSVERGRKDFGSIRGTDQWICFIRISKEMTRKNLDSIGGGTVELRFHQKLLDAPPAKTSW